MEPTFIIAGVRTAIGDFGGSLKGFTPAELGSLVIKEVISRADLDQAQVGHVVLGNVIPTTPKDAYVARVAAVKAGLPVETPALTLNRLCGSGLQAIISAAQMVALGEVDVAVAGGAEVMSRSPHVVPAVRWGQKMGSATMIDALVEVLSDPFENIHMGVTAENVAEKYDISRRKQDELAAESHRRAFLAQENGHFDSQILPVEVKGKGEARHFVKDEHVRGDATADQLGALKPVFKKDGSVTAGNASGINDGAAAVLLASQKAVTEHGLKPMAKILAWGHAGVEPSIMGIGPVKAVPIALQRSGLSLSDMDVIESNEAFAAQACAVANTLQFDAAKTNPNGSGISLGHPIGATGAILTVKAIYELQRIQGRYALVTMCIGGGQGIAMVLERV